MSKKYVFVIYACDGRHESEPKDWKAAHQEAADWHGKTLEEMLESHSQEFGMETWEGGYGQRTAVEEDGSYEEFMIAEFGEDWAKA